MALEARTPEILRFGTFEVDLRAGEVRKQGKRIKVQEQPFHLLTVLLQHPGEVVTREELRNQNWPPDTFVDFERASGFSPRSQGLPAIGFYNWPNLYPVYVRGEAYLAARRGGEAAAEFQKILDHHGIVLNEPIGALAHLQLGRAYFLRGDTAKARSAYNDFLTLWKDADTDIPILGEAKDERAKLN